MSQTSRDTEGMQGDGVRDDAARAADARAKGDTGGSAAGIREHMKVVGSDGAHVGTVDHLEGDREIKLTRRDSDDDEHHFIPTSWVQEVGDAVRLNRSADDARREWRHEGSH